jgi:hypothetical protein
MIKRNEWVKIVSLLLACLLNKHLDKKGNFLFYFDYRRDFLSSINFFLFFFYAQEWNETIDNLFKLITH